MFKPGALAGIRVLDMTRVIAGPYAGQIFGDLGAEVIKIERQGEGDDVRRVGPPWMKDADGNDTKESTYFHAVNRNKQSVTIDYAQPEGAQLLRELATKADVLIENYRPRTLEKYGLGYEDLKAINPRLIYCSLSGFGQTGPYAERSGYDYLVQAMAGLMSVTGLPVGEPGAGPLRVGIPIADIFAGLYSVIGVLAAINHRNNTGIGQYIDVSLFESQLAGMLNTFSAWFNAGAELGRTGNDHPSASPYGVYPVDDGYILIATFNDREFVRLAKALGHAEWSSDERFATNGARVGNRPLLKQLVTDALRGKTMHEWVELLNKATVSCGPLNTMQDIATDPHVQARELIVQMQHEITGPVKVTASPIRLSETPVSYRLPPPQIGEHTSVVLQNWLQLDSKQIDALRAKNVI
ncbi:MAG: caiB/BaiF family protein [Verrucomicrobiaceae bacterium]|nr:caiB/BaiF family protein [Verrucomicrobiaceae bacterium]